MQTNLTTSPIEPVHSDGVTIGGMPVGGGLLGLSAKKKELIFRCCYKIIRRSIVYIYTE